MKRTGLILALLVGLVAVACSSLHRIAEKAPAMIDEARNSLSTANTVMVQLGQTLDAIRELVGSLRQNSENVNTAWERWGPWGGLLVSQGAIALVLHWRQKIDRRNFHRHGDAEHAEYLRRKAEMG